MPLACDEPFDIRQSVASPYAALASSLPAQRSLLSSQLAGDTYSEWRGLEGGPEQPLLVVQIGPLLLTAVVAQLASRQ